MVKGLCIKAGEGAYVTELDGSLESYYDLLGCGCFDIVSRKIGDRYFDIYLDDEGLLKPNPIPSCADKDGNIMLVGNLFICQADDEGDTISISDEDCAYIKHYIFTAVEVHEDKDTGEPEFARVLPILQADY